MALFWLQIVFGWTRPTSGTSRDTFLGQTGRRWPQTSWTAQMEILMVLSLGKTRASICGQQVGNCATIRAITYIFPSSANWQKKICSVNGAESKQDTILIV